MTVILNGTTGITTPGLIIGTTNTQPTFCVQANMLAPANTTSAGWQKVPINNVVSDVPGWWDNTNRRIIPKLPGFYMITGRTRVTSLGISSLAAGFNGVETIGMGSDTNATVLAIGGTATLYCNGTTDFIELFVFASAVRTYNNNGFDTYLQVIGPFGNAV